MQSLEQIRANAAIDAAETKDGGKLCFTRADVAGFPALIIGNGLLSAMAYAVEQDKDARTGLRFACDRTAAHLAKPVHGIGVLVGESTAGDLVRALSSGSASSLDLQRATAEALAFFGYLKRFAAKDQPGGA